MSPQDDNVRMAQRRGRRWARCTAAAMPFSPQQWPEHWIAVECEMVALVRDLAPDATDVKELAGFACREAATLWSELRNEAIRAEQAGRPLRLRRREPPFRPSAAVERAGE
jgi:hypothetical protein